MSPHYSDHLIERYSMGRLQDPALADFERHLLRCYECRAAVCRMDALMECFQNIAEDLRQDESSAPKSSLPTKFNGEYLLVQAALPNTNVESIGIVLLVSDCDWLYYRFRRDLKEFAADEADWFEQLPYEISKKVNEVGAKKCFEWVASTFPATVRIFRRESVLVENHATTLDRLYAKHIRPAVLHFRTHLPQYSLEAAAGKFGKQMDVEPEGWVEISTNIPLTENMFVTHVTGNSMEPLIPDSSLCAFRSNVVGPWEGKILLIEQYGESGGNRYTVKRCRMSKNFDPNQQGDDAWLHQRVTLQSINPEYKSWDVASAGKIRVLGEFLFVI